MKSIDTKPDWWPTGADEELMRECNCSDCRKMIAELERIRQGQARDGENKTLRAYL